MKFCELFDIRKLFIHFLHGLVRLFAEDVNAETTSVVPEVARLFI